MTVHGGAKANVKQAINLKESIFLTPQKLFFLIHGSKLKIFLIPLEIIYIESIFLMSLNTGGTRVEYVQITFIYVPGSQN